MAWSSRSRMDSMPGRQARASRAAAVARASLWAHLRHLVATGEAECDRPITAEGTDEGGTWRIPPAVEQHEERTPSRRKGNGVGKTKDAYLFEAEITGSGGSPRRSYRGAARLE